MLNLIGLTLIIAASNAGLARAQNTSFPPKLFDWRVGKLKHFRTRLPENLFHPEFFKFVKKLNIYDDSKNAVFCNAGLAEKAAGTDIGRYLK